MDATPTQQVVVTASAPEAPANARAGARAWLWNLLLLAVGLIVLIPLALLFGLWFYLAACREVARMLVHAILGRKDGGPSMIPLPAPHFTEANLPGGQEAEDDSAESRIRRPPRG
jgi:hypothetical protein